MKESNIKFLITNNQITACVKKTITVVNKKFFHEFSGVCRLMPNISPKSCLLKNHVVVHHKITL